MLNRIIKNVNYRGCALRAAVGITALALLLANGAGALSNDGGGSWRYYRDIAISNPGAALVDYQVLVNLTGSNFPMNAQTSGADIRFTNSSGAELSYWIENWDYSSRKTMIWVKVPSLPSGETTMRMWYGNPSASSSINGSKVFEFFDDFSSSSIDTNKWIRTNSGGSYAIENGQFSLTDSSTASTYEQWKTVSSFNDPIIIELDAATQLQSTLTFNMQVAYLTSALHIKHTNSTTNGWAIGKDFSNGDSITTGQLYHLKMIFNGTTAALYVDGVQKAQSSYTSGSSQVGLIAVLGDATGWSTSHIHYDNVIIHKYASPEPTVAGISAEKSYFSVEILISGAPVVNESAADVLKVNFSNFSIDDVYFINIFNDINNNGSLDFSEDEIVYTQSGVLNGSQEQIIPVDWIPKSTGLHWVVASGGHWTKKYVEGVFVTDIKPVSPIPELATIVLAGAGMIGILLVSRRCRRN